MQHLLFIALLVAINPIHLQSTATTTTYVTSTCNTCKCYRIKCSRIENPPDNCQDEYTDTCANASDISEESNCNVKCDCCLEGRCLTWSSYYCIMFRSYELFSVIYFLAISINIFLLWRMYKIFFRLKRPYDPENFPNNTREDHTFCKYSQNIRIRCGFGSTKNLVTDMKVRDTIILFSKIEEIESIAVKNFIVLLVAIFLYVIITFLNLYVLFFILKHPYSYGYVSWIQHVAHIGFYVLVFVSSSKMRSYKIAVNQLIDGFEEEHGCKVRIVKKLKLFEINWAPKTVDTKKKRKESSRLLKANKQNSIKEIDAEKEPINKLEIKEGKARINSSKPSPL